MPFALPLVPPAARMLPLLVLFAAPAAPAVVAAPPPPSAASGLPRPPVAALVAPGPVRPQDDSPARQEKEWRDEYRRGLTRPAAEARAAAVEAYGQATRELPVEISSSRLVTRALGDALHDADLSVRAAALTQLAWGRDPSTVFELLDDHIGELRNELEKLWTRPDAESRARRADVQRLFSQLTTIVGRHADDRAVELLEDELRTLRQASGPANPAQALVVPLSQGLLMLGSQRAVESVVKTTNVFSGAVFNHSSGRNTASGLHEALSAFALQIERAPPPFGEQYDHGWRQWYAEHQHLFPKRLGKLKTPIDPPVYVRPDRTPFPRSPGQRERP